MCDNVFLHLPPFAPKVKAFLADPSKFVVAASPAAAPEGGGGGEEKEEATKEESEEESDEDMGMGKRVGQLVGGVEWVRRSVGVQPIRMGRVQGQSNACTKLERGGRLRRLTWWTCMGCLQ